MPESFWDSYVGQLRQAVGHRKLIIPSIRALILNDLGQLLFIKRRGSRQWALPAGGIELDESIYDCLQREVREETGLEVHQATFIALYSGPKHSVVNSYGDAYQGCEFLFRVDRWSGTIAQSTDETVDAAFFSLNALPQIEPGYWREHQQEVLGHFRAFQGTPFID
ncbi:NUDIX domain-containing protein [Paenibacillus piri]|nr:NUDIX domain-containing protein [Paenibacillus piri]